MYYKPEYSVTVPVINGIFQRQGREAVVEQLRKLGAKRVLLARDIYTMNEAKRTHMMESLKDNCAYLKQHGFEVGVWAWSFMIEGTDDSFTRVVSLDRKYEDSRSRCPLDPAFREFAGSFTADLAKTGVDLILFDDDYRLAFGIGHFACGCDLHMARVQELLGEKIAPGDFQQKVFSDGKNKYRDACMQVNREALEGFAQHIRKAVDAVAPTVRIGVCACMNWDADGIDPASISRAFAGSTKPFLRLIGATYWATTPWSIHNRLGAVIEFERMERSWCGDDIEILAEGDVYPRPRYAVPASYLELFDTALMADGGMDGILKYALDYTADPTYEPGYVDAHCRNKALYPQIREVFSPKPACGMRIVEKMKKFGDMEIPAELTGNSKAIDIFYSPAAKMLSSLSIPSTYGESDCCAVIFGENAREIDRNLLKNGAVLDLTAAKILEDAGIDTGLVAVGAEFTPTEEYFVRERQYVAAGFRGFRTEIAPEAVVESRYAEAGTDAANSCPASYYYTNAAGERFFVFTFPMHFNKDTCFRSYTRAGQMIRAAKDLSGTPLPASIRGCPDLYMMCKRSEDGELAVGLWNIFADSIQEPVITLDKAYKDIRFINCTGKLDGNKVSLSRMEPFAFAGFAVQ